MSAARRVAVLGGGRSSEHEISLASAASVADGLARAGFQVIPVTISRDGAWTSEGQVVRLEPGAGLAGAEVVFPVLHGPFGEDGTVQGLLETLEVPYVGAGVLASALCMDKVLFKDLMALHGVPQVDYRAVRAEDVGPERREAVARSLGELGLPVFVKPDRLGSSVGIVRVERAEELLPALDAAFAHDPLAIVEAGASGIEVECSVLGNLEPTASMPGEISLSGGGSGWYDYEAKYTPGGMELMVPARVPEAVARRVQELAIHAFKLVGCAGLARVDFFVDGEQVLVNELNTMPGFTQTSVYASLLVAGGMSYEEVLGRLVELAVERFERERRYRY